MLYIYDLLLETQIPVDDVSVYIRMFVMQHASLVTTKKLALVHFSTIKNLVESDALAMNEEDILKMVVLWCEQNSAGIGMSVIIRFSCLILLTKIQKSWQQRAKGFPF